MMHEDVIGLSHTWGFAVWPPAGRMSSSRLWPRLRFERKVRMDHTLSGKAVASVRAIWSGASPRSARTTRSCELAIKYLDGEGQGRPALPYQSCRRGLP